MITEAELDEMKKRVRGSVVGTRRKMVPMMSDSRTKRLTDSRRPVVAGNKEINSAGAGRAREPQGLHESAGRGQANSSEVGHLLQQRALELPRRSGAGSNPAPSPSFSFSLALTGQLPSGKNQVQLLWRNGKVRKYPNNTFKNWRANASLEIHGQCFRAPNISVPVRLSVEYWPGDRLTRDVSGQLDALFSLLVYVEVLKNDGLIWDVVWKRKDLNRKFPKVVMQLEAWQ